MKLLDSSFCADFLRGRESAKEYRLANRTESLLLTPIGQYELYHGAVKDGRDPVLVDTDLPWVETVEYTAQHALEAARIRHELAEAGQRLQHPDMLIAGVARSIGVPLVTADSGFDQVDGLSIENHREPY